MTARRVQSDTRRGFYWLLVVSLVLHLVLTPFAGLLSFVEGWLARDEAADDSPAEQLKELPIELFEDEPEESKPDVLPEEDPVALIDKIVELPVEAQPAAQPAAKPEPPKPEPPKPAAVKPAKPEGTKPSPSTTSPEADAGAPPPSNSQPQTTAPVPPSSASSPAAEPSSTAPAGSPPEPGSPPSSDIDNPVALAGKGGKIIEKQASVGLILYMDRVRTHPLGKRIAALLPKLPQWDEFFGASRVNPVQDFDRMFLLGPSFSDSSGLVMAIEYNTPQEKIREAVNGLVKQRGSWMTGVKVPTALTYADRAERVIFFPAPKVIVVVPPHLREQAKGVTGVPKAKGPEAMVASTVNPAKVLRRFGVDIPASLQSAKVRLTPLADGGALLELEAKDESAAQAKQTAALLTTQINASIDVLGSVSGIAGIFGFKQLAEVASLPHVKLTADGTNVKGRQVLSQDQVSFILGQVERELARWQARHAPAASPAKPAPATNPAPPKPNKKR